MSSRAMADLWKDVLKIVEKEWCLKGMLNFLQNFNKEEKAKVFKVEVENNREWKTYIANVSVSNPFHTPIRISKLSYILKTAGSREVVSGAVPAGDSAYGLLEKGRNTVMVPMKVEQSKMTELLRNSDWDSKYKLELKVTFVLPHTDGHDVVLTWEGMIKNDVI